MNRNRWPIEDIPDPDILFMRTHKIHFKKDTGELKPSFFKDHGDSMSSNWNKYCLTPEEARRKAKIPEENAVIQFVVGCVRSIPLTVTHAPDYDRQDRSHTDIKGEKTSEVRLKLLELTECVIPLGK